MPESTLITIACAVCAAMFGLLTAVLAWIGAKMYAKMDQMSETLHAISGDLHARINGIDRRVAVVETKIERGAK